MIASWLPVLGGSWVVISGVISPLIWVIAIVTLLITPLITTHEPASISVLCSMFVRFMTAPRTPKPEALIAKPWQ